MATAPLVVNTIIFQDFNKLKNCTAAVRGWGAVIHCPSAVREFMGTGGISRELNCSYAAVRWIPPSLFAISKPFEAHRHDGHGWCHYLSQRQRGHPAVSSLVLYQTGTTCSLWGTTKYERPQISSHKVLAWGGGAASHMQDPSVGSYLLGWPLTAPPAAALG